MVKDAVVVVGATSGIGRACAEILAESYTVVALGRREAKLAELAELGIKQRVFDVTELAGIDELMKGISQEFGKIRAVVYCAGVQSIKPLRTVSPAEAIDMFKTNFFGAMFFAKAMSNKAIRSSENPSIIYVSSIAAQKPEPGISCYSASKAALDNLTKGLAKELAPLRVNAVAPGFLKTEMTSRFSHIYNEEFVKRISESYPLGLGDVADVAKAVRFLISSDADHITGAILTVDGGGVL